MSSGPGPPVRPSRPRAYSSRRSLAPTEPAAAAFCAKHLSAHTRKDAQGLAGLRCLKGGSRSTVSRQGVLGAQASLRLPQSLSNGCANRFHTRCRSEYRLRLDFAEGRQRRKQGLGTCSRLGLVAASDRVVNLLEESCAVRLVLDGDEETGRGAGLFPLVGLVGFGRAVHARHSLSTPSVETVENFGLCTPADPGFPPPASPRRRVRRECKQRPAPLRGEPAQTFRKVREML